MIGVKRGRAKSKRKETFLSKLFDILGNTDYASAISWDTDGKKIIIFDVTKLCNEILPKYYKHRNYSSFIRQLNLYGFHKSKGINDNLEKYEHGKFYKNMNKDDIKKMTKIARHNQMVKCLDMYINSNKDEETKDNEFNTTFPEDKVLNYLTKKVDENNKIAVDTQKDIEVLKTQIIALNDELQKCKSILNSNKIVLNKLIKSHINQNISNKRIKKISDIKELFKNYLYYMKIYSPFVSIDSNKLIKQKEKVNIIMNNKDKLDIAKYNYSNEFNNSREIDNMSFLNDTNNNIQFFDLNLLNINFSNSFINNKSFK